MCDCAFATLFLSQETNIGMGTHFVTIFVACCGVVNDNGISVYRYIEILDPSEY